MGCDIHLYVEKRAKNGKWVYASAKKHRCNTSFGEQYGYDYWYDGRNYSLFSILANVRNGWGFAGVPTGEGFIPISEPRGLPSNVCSKIKTESDGWGGDGHSHSWLTLKELQDYDWKGHTTIHIGVVNEQEFKEYLENGVPSGWAGGISGDGITTVTNDEMRDIISGVTPREPGKRYITSIKWPESYYSCTRDFVDRVIPNLAKIGDPEDVRIVFWFDN